MKHRYTFKYADWKQATVTVYAANETEAHIKAYETLDRRCEKANREPPVAWTLTLLNLKDI